MLLLWIIYVISFLFLLCFRARLFIDALWSSTGKGLTYWLSFVMSNCEVVTFPLVSLVRCGAWLYRFLIFALFLTLFDRWCVLRIGTNSNGQTNFKYIQSILRGWKYITSECESTSWMLYSRLILRHWLTAEPRVWSYIADHIRIFFFSLEGYFVWL